MIKRHPDGFGFFIPDDNELPDVYIPRHSMEGIMTNDRVSVRVEPERGGDRFRGDIVRILQRGTKQVVGAFTPLPDGGGLIRDEGKGWGHDLKIARDKTMNAKKGELVVAEILAFPEDGKDFRGQITSVIGDAADPMNDIQRIAHSLNIPQEFSNAAKAEAAKLTNRVSEADMKGRKDLRKLNFVTIDGATAKDFDDAIYVESNSKGFLLYVAIADVSHYVRPGSAIDKDALERGTSVYFPNFVIPMLPEILSNELCSLNPHVPRLALVAEMQMDHNGHVTRSDFYEAVIESHARVTYGEAQELIDGKDIEKLKHVKADILKASDLAKILMAKRFAEGSLDLEIPETQLMIDAAGNPVDIIRSERLFAHRLIEEMMLAANVAVARFLAEKEVPALYRIHESPNPDAIMVLEKYLRTFGGRVRLNEGKLQKRLTKALEEFEAKSEAQVLNILTLRSMAQAKYSSNNVGHFGLGFEFYTHFTSPIRRYPDLIVHRLIKSQVMPKSGYRLMTEEDLSTAGAMLSATEQRSVKAERQIQGIKKARFMEKHVGEEFDGMISSVTKFGVFVLLRQFEVDGLIHVDNLGKEQFEYDEENLRLVARRSGRSFSIGDPIKVRVVSANAEEGKIDFEPADMAPRKTGSAARFEKSSRERRGSSRADKPPKRRRSERNDSKYERPSRREEEPAWRRSKASRNAPAPASARGSQQASPRPQNFSNRSAPAEASSPGASEKFDPGKKLEEALRRRGLQPSGAMYGDQNASQKIGFGANSNSHPRRRREDREREGDEERREGADRRKSFKDRGSKKNSDSRNPRRDGGTPAGRGGSKKNGAGGGKQGGGGGRGKKRR